MAKAKLKPQAKKKVTARQAQLLAQLKSKKPMVAPKVAPAGMSVTPEADEDE